MIFRLYIFAFLIYMRPIQRAYMTNSKGLSFLLRAYVTPLYTFCIQKSRKKRAIKFTTITCRILSNSAALSVEFDF